jgi:diaminopimelate epimerase
MRARLPITKMAGAGNDFVVLADRVWEEILGDRAAWVRGVCRRGVSVGADGVIVVSTMGPGRARVVFFNPDGGEAFCGNGSRCAARYALDRRLVDDPSMILETAVGDVPAIVTGGRVAVTLPPPSDRGPLELPIGGETVSGRFVIAGVPHFVVPVYGVASYALERIAPPLRRHAAFGPDGTNVDFVERDAEGRIHVRTYERGVENETLSCGTGAVAAAYAARLEGAPESIVVIPRSGLSLSVTLPGAAAHPRHAQLAGDARFVFDGEVSEEGVLVGS